MNSEKELFNLSKSFVMLEQELDRLLNRFSPEYEIEEIKRDMDEIRNTILNKNYDIDKFIYYQQMYKEMSVKEYFDFIKTL